MMVSSTRKYIFLATNFRQTKHEKLKPTSFVHENGTEAARVLSFNFLRVQASFYWVVRTKIDGFKVRVNNKQNSLSSLPIQECNDRQGKRHANFKRWIWLTELCLTSVIFSQNGLEASGIEFWLRTMSSFLLWSIKPLKQIGKTFDQTLKTFGTVDQTK